MTRIERVTSPLPRECSTTEPHGPNALLASGVPGTDPARFPDRTAVAAIRCRYPQESGVNPELLGAGEGNRTLVISLEGFCSTIELHPPEMLPIPIAPGARPRFRPGCSAALLCWWRGLDSNQRRRKPTDLQSAPFSRSGTPPLAQRTANYVCATAPCQTGRGGHRPWRDCAGRGQPAGAPGASRGRSPAACPRGSPPAPQASLVRSTRNASSNQCKHVSY